MSLLSPSFTVQSISEVCWLHPLNISRIPPLLLTCIAATGPSHHHHSTGLMPGLPGFCPSLRSPHSHQSDPIKTNIQVLFNKHLNILLLTKHHSKYLNIVYLALTTLLVKKFY